MRYSTLNIFASLPDCRHCVHDDWSLAVKYSSETVCHFDCENIEAYGYLHAHSRLQKRLTHVNKPWAMGTFLLSCKQPDTSQEVNEDHHGIKDVDHVQVADGKPAHQFLTQLATQRKHKDSLQASKFRASCKQQAFFMDLDGPLLDQVLHRYIAIWLTETSLRLFKCKCCRSQFDKNMVAQ